MPEQQPTPNQIHIQPQPQPVLVDINSPEFAQAVIRVIAQAAQRGDGPRLT